MFCLFTVFADGVRGVLATRYVNDARIVNGARIVLGWGCHALGICLVLQTVRAPGGGFVHLIHLLLGLRPWTFTTSIVVCHNTDFGNNDADSHHPRAAFSSTALCTYTPEKAFRERDDFFCVSLMLNPKSPRPFFFFQYVCVYAGLSVYIVLYKQIFSIFFFVFPWLFVNVAYVTCI